MTFQTPKLSQRWLSLNELTFWGAVGADQLRHLQLYVRRGIKLHLPGTVLRELLHGVGHPVFLAEPDHGHATSAQIKIVNLSSTEIGVTYLPRIRTFL